MREEFRTALRSQPGADGVIALLEEADRPLAAAKA
jgi:hypothetical protein